MSDVRWEGFTHQEIYDRVRHGPGGTASTGATAAWKTVEDTLRGVDAQLSEAVQRIGLGWEGVAADGARGGMQGMSRWAVDAADNALLTWNGVADQARGADVVRHAMPPPRPALDVAVAAASAGGYVPRATSAGEIEDQAAQERARAVDLMNRYTGASSSNQLLMDHWTPPPTVVVETVPRGGAAAGGGGGGAGGRGPGGGGAVLVPAAPGARGTPPRGAPGVLPDPAGGIGAAGSPGRPGARDGPRGAGAGADPTAEAGRDLPAPPVVPGPLAGGAGAGRPPDSTSRPPGPTVPGGVRPVVPGPPPRPGTGGPVAPTGSGAGGPAGSGVGRYPGPPGGDRSAAVPAPGVRLPGEPRGGAGAPTGGAGSPGPSEGAGGGRGGADPARPAATERGAAGAGFLPLGGAGAGSADGLHRRPDYLVDDADVFADDRWFTPAVLAADDQDGWDRDGWIPGGGER